MSTAMLVINNLRDRETDGAAGKRTLAVRFGDRFTVAQYFACLAGGRGRAGCGGGVHGVVSPLTFLALGGLLPCVPAARRVLDFADRRALNPALAQTARGVAFYGAGLGVGALVGAAGVFGA